MEIILLYLITAFILFQEARIEAKKGDKHHWPSLVLTFLLNQGFVYLIDQELNWQWHVIGAIIYCSERAWFDPLIAVLRGKKWSYLGTVSWTDRILWNIPPVLLLFMRFVFSAVGVSATIILFQELYAARGINIELQVAIGVITCMLGGCLVLYSRLIKNS